jgi:hypothetical protein
MTALSSLSQVLTKSFLKNGMEQIPLSFPLSQRGMTGGFLMATNNSRTDRYSRWLRFDTASVLIEARR